MPLSATTPLATIVPADEPDIGLPTRAAGDAGAAAATRRGALRQLEWLAQTELKRMRLDRGGEGAAPVTDDALVWVGIAWDLGLTGGSLEDAALSNAHASLTGD